jgi:hypothetical protein
MAAIVTFSERISDRLRRQKVYPMLVRFYTDEEEFFSVLIRMVLLSAKCNHGSGRDKSERSSFRFFLQLVLHRNASIVFKSIAASAGNERQQEGKKTRGKGLERKEKREGRLRTLQGEQ